MGKTWLLIWQDLRSKPKLWLVTGLLTCFVSMILGISGIATAQSSSVYETISQKLNVPDLFLFVTNQGAKEVETGSVKVNGSVQKTPFYPVYGGALQYNDYHTSVNFVVCPIPMSPANKFQMMKGNYLSEADPYGVLIDVGLATHEHLKVGSVVRLSTQTNTHLFTVRGIEYDGMHVLFPHQHPPFIYVASTAMHVIAPGLVPSYQILGVHLKNPAVAAKTLQNLSTFWPATTLISDQGVDRASMGMYYESNNLTTTVVLWAFSVLGLLAAWMIVGNLIATSVRSRTRQLGIFKQLGFSPIQLYWTLVLQNAFVALFASTVGVVLSRWAEPFFAAPQVKLMELSHNTNGSLNLYLGIVVLIQLVVWLATVIPTWRAIHVQTLQSIVFGDELPRTHRFFSIETLAHMGPLYVGLGIGELTSKPIRTLITLAVMIFAAGSLVFAITASHIMDKFSERPDLFGMYTNITISIQNNDISKPLQCINHMPNVDRYWLQSKGMKITVPGVDGSFQLMAIDSLKGDLPYQIQRGSGLMDIGDIIVAQGFLTASGLDVGDMLHTSLNGHNTSLKIVGQFFDMNDMGHDAVVSFQTLRKYQPDVNYDVLALKLTDYHFANRDAAKLYPLLGQTNVNATDLTLPDEAITSQRMITWMAVAFSLISMLSLWNVLSRAVSEQGNKIGVIKSIGMSPLQIVGMVATSGIFLGIIAAIVGIPVGCLLTIGAFDQVGNMLGAGRFPVFIPWNTVIDCVPVFLVFIVAASIAPARKASQVRPVSILRAD